MYIGQQVVAITDWEGLFKKGDTFVIKDVKQACICSGTIIDIGLNRPSDTGITECYECKSFVIKGDYISAKYFVPVDYKNVKNVTFEKILEKIPIVANTLLIFVFFLCSSFYVKKGWTYRDKLYVKERIEKHLKSIINNSKNFECTCKF